MDSKSNKPKFRIESNVRSHGKTFNPYCLCEKWSYSGVKRAQTDNHVYTF